MYDVYHQQCPSRQVLEIISNKWVILIIQLLAEKKHRFGELKQAIGGISAKVLSHLLKNLESYHLVVREEMPGLVLHVEYSLTPTGLSLSELCHAITSWAEDNIESLI